MITLSTCCRTLYSKSCMRNKLMYQRALPLMYQKNEAAIYTNTRNVRITTSCNIRSSNNKFISSTRNTRANTSKGKDGNVSPHTFTVFSAGAAKKRSAMAQNKVEEQAHMDFVESKIKLVIPSVPLGHKEWSKLKEEHGTIRGFEDFVMSKMVSTQSDINVAKSLLNFAAKENNGISYKLLLKYLALCGKLNLVSEMYDVYDIMKSRFKSFDTGAYSLFIKGFSQTDRWRESIDMLETIKKTIIPSPRNYGDCIQGAIHHRRGDKAWGLYQEMLQHDLTPCEDTFQCLFNADRDMQDEAFRNELRCVLDYLRDHQIYPGESLMQSIKFWFESNPNENWRGHLSRISDSGRCEVCRQQLESIHLTPEEYKTLKDSVLDSVIKGRDTFRKTTPQELQEFQQFVRSRPPYDIVIDGLNVAHMSLKEVRSQTLLHVVTSLSSGGKRALVLGRKHMLKESRAWVRRHMQQLQQQADCFFLDDISEDDPFLLYASLSSGSHCCFLTRDLLRDHKACLPDAHTKRLFFKWQRGHQLVLPFYTPGKKVLLQPILSYDTILQSTDLSWHIPYDKIGVERASYEVPKTWLCLQRSH